MKEIIKIRTNNKGNITDVMFEDGKIIPLASAIDLAYRGEIKNVSVGKAKDATLFIRSNPNNKENDNLKNLPRF